MNKISGNKVGGGKYSQRRKYPKQSHEPGVFQGLERSLVI